MNFTLIALFTSFGLMPLQAGEYHPGYSHTQTCYKSQYHEEYVPGTYSSPGYVKTSKNTIEVPCISRQIKTFRTYHPHAYRHNHFRYSNNYTNHPIASSKVSRETKRNCSAATTTGGLVGGGLAAALSRKDAYGWSIPLGAVLGMGLANADC